MRKATVIAVLLVPAFASVGAFGNPICIQGVPDWDQPVVAGPPPALHAGWDAWCVPTATANIMGYLRSKGINVGDALVFPNKNSWVGPPMANDYEDDTADPRSANPPAFGVARGDIGWFMNTNDYGPASGAPGGTYAGTKFMNILPGVQGYLAAHGYNAPWVQNAATAASGLNTLAGGPYTVASVWPVIKAQIDAGDPMIGSFLHGAFQNRAQVRGGPISNLPNYDCATWKTISSYPQYDCACGETWDGQDLGHSMTVVGYFLGGGVDATNPFYLPGNPGATPNAIIVYDNRDGFLGNNPLPLVLPFDATAPWLMNTLIAVPEPATLTAGALLFGALAVRRRRDRRGRIT